MKKRNRASLQAGLVVEKALKSGLTLTDISEKTGTGLSTIQRWRSTGKGEAILVRKLERLVGSVEVTPEELATYLAEEYTSSGGKSAFAVYGADLYRVVGPPLDANGYLEDVREKLRLRGYELLQTRKVGRVIYHVISVTRINGITHNNIRDMRNRWREISDESMDLNENETD